jgi:hypothetical protein
MVILVNVGLIIVVTLLTIWGLRIDDPTISMIRRRETRMLRRATRRVKRLKRKAKRRAEWESRHLYR